jgi:hypothetical protein
MASGQCLCGNVKFVVGSATSNMAHCHCSMCRKLHGSLFATFYNVESVDFTSGTDFIETYESSPGFIRTFCNCCGSPLPEKAPNSHEYYVPAGLLNEDPAVRADKHIFVESKAECYHITDDLPQEQHYGDGDLSRVIDNSQPQISSDSVSGSCQCGTVSFEYSGTPKFMMNCHCSRCRKVKGAAHATNVFVACEDLTWKSGENNVVKFALPDAKFFGNAFCRTCGSSVPRARSDGSVYNIPAGSLDQAPGIDAKGHIFMGSKAPWIEVTDDLPQWDEMST